MVQGFLSSGLCFGCCAGESCTQVWTCVCVISCVGSLFAYHLVHSHLLFTGEICTRSHGDSYLKYIDTFGVPITVACGRQSQGWRNEDRRALGQSTGAAEAGDNQSVTQVRQCGSRCPHTSIPFRSHCGRFRANSPSVCGTQDAAKRGYADGSRPWMRRRRRPQSDDDSSP